MTDGMAAVIWFAAGVALVAAEAVGGDLVLLMLGGGAFSAAVAMWVGAPLWLAAIIFAIVSVLLVVGVRPVAKRHLLHPPVATGIEALVGHEAVVIDAFGDDGGRVRIDGDVWSAAPALEGDSFHRGERVIVRQIDGATALVERGNP